MNVLFQAIYKYFRKVMGQYFLLMDQFCQTDHLSVRGAQRKGWQQVRKWTGKMNFQFISPTGNNEIPIRVIIILVDFLHPEFLPISI